MDDSFSDPRPDDDDVAGGAHRRAGQRDSLFLQATLRRDDDAPPVTIRIRNLSAGGMMAEIGEPFVVGDHIAIELRGFGPLDGTVIWREDRRIGIAFAHEIDPRLARKAVPVRPAAAPAAAPPPRTVRRPKLFGE